MAVIKSTWGKMRRYYAQGGAQRRHASRCRLRQRAPDREKSGMTQEPMHASGPPGGDTRSPAAPARWRARAALTALFLASAAAAEPTPDVSELGLEQLLNLQVSAASKFPQKLSEAPANVTVITAADIRAFGYRTLADILNSVPGLHVYTDREYDFLGVRGFARSGDYNGRVLVVVDGYRVNDPVYATGTIGTEFILDVDLIDRVEFVQGPGSSIYGSNAFLGVVNVISKKGRQVKGAEVSVEVASDHADRQRLTYGQRFHNGLDVVASATRSYTRGADLYFPEYDAPETNNGVAEGRDGERFHDLLLKAEWGGFSVEAAQERRWQGSPTGSFGCVFNDPRCTVEDIQSLVQLRYDTVIEGDSDLQLRLYNGRYDYNGHYPYDAGDGSTVLNIDGSRAAWWGGEIKLVSSAWDRHKLVTGAEYTRNHDVDQFNYDRDPYLQYADNRSSSTSLGVYVQDDIRLSSRLALIAGLRGDQISDYRRALSPRAALIFRVTPASTLKLTYGTAFRAPAAYEAAQVLPGVQKANPDLQPETTRNVGLTFEQVREGRWRWGLSAFHNQISDLISQVEDPDDGLLVFRNVSSAQADGAQLAGEWLGPSGLHARSSYAYQRVIDGETHRAIVNSPRHLAKLNLLAPLPAAGVDAGLELLYTGARRSEVGAAGGYTLASLTLRHSGLLPGLSIAASAYNLFDRDYDLVGTEALTENGLFTIAGNGRSLRLKLQYSF